MMGVRMNGIIVFSVVLLFAQFQKTFEASTSPCQPGFYYNGGHCIPCAPCPKSLKDRNKWYNEECLVAFYDCPRLCTQRFPDWSSDELADDKICDDLGYQYTTEPSSTTNGVTNIPSTTTVQTSTNQDHTTLSKALNATYPTPKQDASVSGGWIFDQKWIYIPAIVGGLLFMLIVVTSRFWCTIWRKGNKSESNIEENRKLISSADICRDCSITPTSSSSISLKCRNAQSESGVIIKLRYGRKVLQTKPLRSSEDIEFGFSDGIRPGKTFTLEFVTEGDGKQESDDTCISYTMPGFLSTVESSSTTVTAHCYSNSYTDYFSVNLYDIQHDKEILMASTTDCNQARFDEKSGILPGRKYKVQAVETSDSDWRDEHLHHWKEEQIVSTPAWTFDAKVDGERIQINNLPNDTAAQGLRKKYSGSCFIKFCSCVGSLNGGQRHHLPESGSSFSIDYPFKDQCTSMPVRLCIQTAAGEHVAGKQMIEIQRSDRGEEGESARCEVKFTDICQDLRQDLTKSLNPEKFERFCLVFIQLCNKLAGNNKEQFSEDLAKARTTGDEFLDQISPTFVQENMRNTTIYQLVQGFLTKDARQLFSNELDLFVGAILRHHDCSACRALIHKVLHEEELLNAHPPAVVSVNDETLSPCESQRNEALTRETTIGDFDDVPDTSDCNTNGNAICLQTINRHVSNGYACQVGTPV